MIQFRLNEGDIDFCIVKNRIFMRIGQRCLIRNDDDRIGIKHVSGQQRLDDRWNRIDGRDKIAHLRILLVTESTR